MKAISIPANGTPEVIEFAGDYQSISDAVDGWIQALYTPVDESATLYLNEEGKLIGKPANQNTDVLAKLDLGLSPYDVIVGDVIIVGTDDEGETMDVPQAVIDHLGL